MRRLTTCAARAAMGLVAFAAVGAGSPSLATADDPIGLPKPYLGPPLVTTSPGAVSPWVRLKHQPPFDPGSMLLLSDGTVLVHEDDANRWAELIPNRRGSYVDGHWRRAASLPAGYAPMYFASAVLPDGRVVITGGEYDGGNKQVETNQGAVYDPTRDAWRRLAAPLGWSEIGDAQSTVLDDGRLLVADVSGSDDALLDPTTLTWSVTGAGKLDPNSEEGFSLLHDGRVLTVDTEHRGSELFNPNTGTWSSAGKIPTQLVDAASEQGPLISGPDGSVFAVGATGHTAVYHPHPGQAGSWSVGPTLPVIGKQLVASDASGARLPNGKVLLDASPPGQVAPTYFFIYNGHRLHSQAENATARKVSTYDTRMLVLPNGQVLYDDSLRVYVFKSKGTPRGAWLPRIGSVDRRLPRGKTLTLSGTQLAGLDQGAAFGDDFQDNTNYPLVRLVSLSSGTVTYARTFDWSSVSTAPGTRSSTQFRIPRRAPLGKSSLVVVANGIASKSVTVTVTR